MPRLSDCKCQETTKQDTKICTIRDNGAMRITTGAMDALTCLPTLNLVVQARQGQLHIDSDVWAVGLTFSPIEYIIATSEVGSHI
jgi:hypothetical protein